MICWHPTNVSRVPHVFFAEKCSESNLEDSQIIGLWYHISKRFAFRSPCVDRGVACAQDCADRECSDRSCNQARDAPARLRVRLESNNQTIDLWILAISAQIFNIIN